MSPVPRCLIPRFDGAILSQEGKEATWDRFVTAASRVPTSSHPQDSDQLPARVLQRNIPTGVNVARAAWSGVGHQPQDGREVAETGIGRGCDDRPSAPRSTVLSGAEEAMVVAFRRHTLVPLDDCLCARQPSIPHTLPGR